MSMLPFTDRATGQPSAYTFSTRSILSRSFSSAVEGLLDPFDDEHLALGLYFSHRVGVETILVKRNLTRYQRASKGAKQSAASRSDEVV
jgi:hypothetical protein